MTNGLLKKIAIGGILLAGLASPVIPGCTRPEYEQRINASFADPHWANKKEETLKFYKSINPYNLTEQQKRYLDEFERNPKVKEQAFPWMNSEKLTLQDKIYIEADQDAANSMIPAARN